MKKQKILSLIALVILTLGQIPTIFAQSGGTFEIKQSVVANGGGNISGGLFSIDGTIGQAIVGQLVTNANFSLSSGFWAADASNYSYSINPTSASVQAVAGSGSITVTAMPGCLWSAVSNDAWLSITSGNTGNGSGTIAYSVAVNSGASRTGTITIAGQTFSITQDGAAGAQGFEGDVSPRSGGDGFVDSDDVQQIRRFSVGLDKPLLNNEGQRGDCSPRSTFGDGFIDSDDVAQARRYSVGLDAKQSVSGPASNAPQTSNNAKLQSSSNLKNSPSSGRAVRIVNQSTSAGQTVVIPINVDTTGDETSYTFTINYDQAKLTNPVVSIGNLGGNVVSNTTVSGKIGFSVTSLSGANGTIAPVNDGNLVNVTFTVAANAATGSIDVVFTDDLARRKVSGFDPNNPIQQPTFTDGTVTIAAPTAASVSVSGRILTQTGRGIRNVVITMIDTHGGTRTVTSTNFGYYQFNDVPAGETYILTAKGKRFTFEQATQILSVAEDTIDINFISNSESGSKDLD